MTESMQLVLVTEPTKHDLRTRATTSPATRSGLRRPVDVQSNLDHLADMAVYRDVGESSRGQVRGRHPRRHRQRRLCRRKCLDVDRFVQNGTTSLAMILVIETVN